MLTLRKLRFLGFEVGLTAAVIVVTVHAWLSW